MLLAISYLKWLLCIVSRYFFVNYWTLSFSLQASQELHAFPTSFFYENVIVVDLKKSCWNYTICICVFVCIQYIYIFNDNHIIMFHVTCNVQSTQLLLRGMIIQKIHTFLLLNKWTKVFSPSRGLEGRGKDYFLRKI